MAKLYIIGNGFDIAHGMETSYGNFRKWLDKQKGEAARSLLWAFDQMGYHCSTGDIWSSVEEQLGKIDIEEILLEIVSEHETDANEGSDIGKIQAAANAWMRIYEEKGLSKVSDLFKEWICSVELAVEKVPQYEELTTQNIYLTFNYTDTLEELYSIPSSQIVHIHGDIKNKGTDLVFGHGKKYNLNHCQELGDLYLWGDVDGAVRDYGEALNTLYKDTSAIYEDNIGWFDSLTQKSIDNIYVLGCSLGEVDDKYFQEISTRLSNVNWHFALYVDRDWQRRLQNEESIRRFIKRMHLKKEQCLVFDSENPEKVITL